MEDHTVADMVKRNMKVAGELETIFGKFAIIIPRLLQLLCLSWRPPASIVIMYVPEVHLPHDRHALP